MTANFGIRGTVEILRAWVHVDLVFQALSRVGVGLPAPGITRRAEWTPRCTLYTCGIDQEAARVRCAPDHEPTLLACSARHRVEATAHRQWVTARDLGIATSNECATTVAARAYCSVACASVFGPCIARCVVAAARRKPWPQPRDRYDADPVRRVRFDSPSLHVAHANRSAPHGQSLGPSAESRHERLRPVKLWADAA
jgi:hypothetical protein